MEGSAKKSSRAGRIQTGNIHVCIRGNCRKVVFLDDADRIEFLKRCNLSAKQFDTKIEAFVLMDNHIHLQVITNQLTPFVKKLLNGFSYWYNRKYSLSDKLFRTPFMSYCKYSEEWRLNSLLYILNNPVNAGICFFPSDYAWSSYHFVFHRKNHMANYIQIDTSLIYKHFKNSKELDEAIKKITPAESSNSKTKSIISESENSKVGKNHNKNINEINRTFSSRSRMPTYEVVAQLAKILNGRNLYSLERKETEETIVMLRKFTGASYIQISQIFNESYEYVRRVCDRAAVSANSLKIRT